MNPKTTLIRRLIILGVVSLSFLAGCGGGGSPAVNNQPPVNNPPGTTVVVTPASATVFQGATVKFQAQVVGQSNQAVTWSIQQGLGTIDSTGVYTAPRDAYGGPFNVVATSQAVPSAQGSAVVNVAPIQVTVTPATITLTPGGTQTFTATVEGLVNTDVTWTVQEPAGGSITNTGFYTASLTTGFYNVVATSVADATRSGSATITVTTSSGRFTPTGTMQNARGFHTATLLANGRVLVAGGTIRRSPMCIGGITSAELYDSVAGSFTPTGIMTTPRYAHTATLLLNGEVLVTGGFGSGFDCEDLGTPALSSAELYDPSTGSFKATGSMAGARGGHTATLLRNGKVLVVGGVDSEGGVASKSAELYDPATGVFTSTGSMGKPRFGQTATLLSNGRVLVVGGVDSTDPKSPAATAAAEIYDPATDAFTPTGSMATARAGHTATLLLDGRVLIAGGSGLSTAEVYDPATKSFSPTGGMGEARAAHAATLLSNGTVLVAGGSDSTAELYDPSMGSFSPTGGMETGRAGHSATLLLDGKVLVVGGGSFSPLVTAELYK